jgi:hypothetical protein
MTKNRKPSCKFVVKYQCQFCGKKFSSKATYETHLLLEHGIKVAINIR